MLWLWPWLGSLSHSPCNSSDPYLTVSRFYLKPDPDVPLTNTTLMALWRQHISGGIEELTKATFDQVFNGTWVLMPYVAECQEDCAIRSHTRCVRTDTDISNIRSRHRRTTAY